MSRLSAQKEVRSVAKKYGKNIRIITGAVTGKDDYGHAISRDNTYIELKAFPIRFKPTEKDRERAGILKAVDIMIWLPLRSLDLLSYSYDQIDIEKGKIKFEDKIYKIIEKNRVNQYADSFLHVTIGAVHG